MITLHNAVFGWFQRAFENWFLGLAARLIFAGTLFMYFYGSAKTKVGEGLAGLGEIQDGAYIQILPQVMEQVGYDASQIPLWPMGWMVYAGTYAEFILPVLIVLGFMTRIAAVGMLVFIAVQSYVDIAFHSVDAATIGAWFDNQPGSVIADQRAFWAFLLLYLALRGAGAVSLDRLFGGRARDEDDYDDYY
ncbi:MAG: DoxX family protein [Pseudomonadota bacterium]